MKHLVSVRASILALSVAATAIALYKSPAIFDSQWEGNHGYRFVGFLVALFGLAALLRFLATPQQQRLAAVIVPAIFVVLTGGIGPTVAFLYLAVACLALGSLVRGRDIQRTLGGAAAAAIDISIGLAIVVGSVGVLSHFPVNRFPVYAVLLAIPIVFGWRVAVGYVFMLRTWLTNRHNIAGCEYWMAAMLIGILLSHVPHSILPERGHDALAMHLLIPTQISANGVWSYDVKQFVWAVMPMGGDWLYTVAFLLGGETSAKLTNFGLFFLVVLLFQSRARVEIGSYALLLTAWLASIPLAFLESATLFVENALTLFLFSAFIVVADNSDRLSLRTLVALTILGGAALHTKLHAILALLPIGIIALWRIRHQLSGKPRWWPTLITASLIFILVGIQPYAFAYATTGNPVFPFFNAIFGSEFFDQTRNFEDARWIGKLSWSLLYDMTFASHRFFEGSAGVIGLGFAIFGVPIIALTVLNGKAIARNAVAVWITYTAAVLLSTQYIRYLYPAFPFLILAGIILFERQRIGTRLQKFVVYLLLATIVSNLFLIPAAGGILQRFPTRELVDDSSRKEFILRDVPQRALIDIENNLNAGRANIAVLGQPIGAGLVGTPYYANWYNESFRRDLLEASRIDEVGKALARRDIEFVVSETTWLGNHPMVREFIRDRTVLVRRVGTAELRQVNEEVLYDEELLKNGEFEEKHVGWRTVGQVGDGTPLTFSPGSRIEQDVQVAAANGRHFLYYIEYDCTAPDYFVAQVGWLNSDGEWLDARSEVAGCSGPGRQSVTARFTRPAEADRAIVYVMANSNLRVYKLSFRGRNRIASEMVQ